MHHMTRRLKSIVAAEALGLCLRRTREQRNISRASLANKLSIDPSQISRIERGRMLYVSHNVLKICTYLEVQPDSFVDQSLAGQPSIQNRLLHLNALLGGRQMDDAAVGRLLDALEAFVEIYSAR